MARSISDFFHFDVFLSDDGFIYLIVLLHHVPFEKLVLSPTSEHNTLACLLKHFVDKMRPLQLPGFCGPWSFWYTALAGDQEFFRDVLRRIGAGNYYGCRKTICRKCDASSTKRALDFRDFCGSANHRQTCKTTEEVLATTPKSRWCPLFDVDGYSLESEAADLMHNLFQEGLVGSFGSSAIVILCKSDFYGPAPKSVNDVLFSDNLETCHDHASRFVQYLVAVSRGLLVSMFVTRNQVLSKGPQVIKKEVLEEGRLTSSAQFW